MSWLSILSEWHYWDVISKRSHTPSNVIHHRYILAPCRPMYAPLFTVQSPLAFSIMQLLVSGGCFYILPQLNTKEANHAAKGHLFSPLVLWSSCIHICFVGLGKIKLNKWVHVLIASFPCSEQYAVPTTVCVSCVRKTPHFGTKRFSLILPRYTNPLFPNIIWQADVLYPGSSQSLRFLPGK